MPVIDIPEIGSVEFPNSMSMDDISSAAEDLYNQHKMPAEAEALAAEEAGAPRDIKLNPPILHEPDISAWQKFRQSDWGRKLFGPTAEEKEAGAQSQGSPAEIASKMLEFTTVPPPLKPAVVKIAEYTNPLALLGPKGKAIGTAVGETLANLPIAPLAGSVSIPSRIASAAEKIAVPIGAPALALFGAEYVKSLPDAREAYKKALENGDAPEAIKIATQTMLGGTLLGAGAIHAAASKPEVVAPKTTEAVSHAAETLKTPLTEIQVEGRTVEITPEAAAVVASSPVHQQLLDASAKVKANAADAIGSVKLALASVRQQIEAARAKPAQSAAEAAASAAQSLATGKAAPEQASADMLQRAQDALNRADDIFGLVEGGEETGAAVKPADFVSALDALAEAIKPLPIQQPQQPKEGEQNAIYSTTGEILPNVQAQPGEGAGKVPTTERPGENVETSGRPQGQTPGGGAETLAKEQAAGGALPAAEPPIASGMKRLYRAESISKQAGETPAWIKDHPEYQSMLEASGRWFYGTRSEAESFAKNFVRDGGGESKITFIDIPESQFESFRVSNQKGSEAQKFSAQGRHGEEFFVSKEHAANRKDLTITEKTVTDLADKLGVKWDNDPAFMARTKVLTGKEHLSELNPEELQKVYDDLNKPSGKGIGIVPEGTQLSMETVGNPGWWSRYFTSQRGLPEGVPEAWLKRMGEVRAETRGAAYAARDLANKLREEYNIGVGKLAVGGLKDVPKPTMDAIQRVLTAKADINTLPMALREPVQKIRDHVDELSNVLSARLEAQGNEGLAANIDENLGAYLTRSYRIFDDPKWIEKIPPAIRLQAESFLQNQLMDRAATDIAKSSLGWDRLTPEREASPEFQTAFEGARASVDPTEFRDAATVKLREMLADWSDNGLDKLMRSGKLGSKDISLFMQRKDIAPEIRAVMGEYGDPIMNYVRSITKMSRWLGDQEFLNKVKEIGMGRWLFEEGQSPTGFEHLLAAESSDTMSPLNGLRTSEAIKDVFENFNKSKDLGIWRWYFMLNAWSKQAKTVFSALTQARNFIGNPFFNVKSGHFNFQDYGKAFKTQLADIAGSNKAAHEFYQEMTKYGLVDENPVVGELRATIRDAGLQDPNFEDYSMKGWARILRLAVEAPQRAYRLPDEMGKTVGWLAEQKDLKRAHPDWTEDQIKQEAATRVRNEYPTYSMIPEAVQQFRKQIIIGPFVNFAYETVRNSYWALRNGSADLFAGDNAMQRAIGAKKLAGFAAVMASGYALKQTGNQIFNIQKDADEDLRRFQPNFSKNHQRIIFDQEGTKFRYIDWSYLNPYNQMTDPFVAALNNDETGILNGSAAAFAEFLKPFVNEQMILGALDDVVKNRDANDNRIYNPQDDGKTKFLKVTDRLLRSIEPGSLERFQTRIWPAMTGKPWPSGDERNVALEVFSELSGLRMEQKDLTHLFAFKVREFASEDLKDARRLATSVLFSVTPPTTEEGAAAYRKADDARFRLWRELYKDYSAVERQGAEPAEIKKIFDSVRLSAIEIGKLMSGNYEPLEINAKDYTNAGREPQADIIAGMYVERGERMGKRLDEKP